MGTACPKYVNNAAKTTAIEIGSTSGLVIIKEYVNVNPAQTIGFNPKIGQTISSTMLILLKTWLSSLLLSLAVICFSDSTGHRPTGAQCTSLSFTVS
jgi:hypothetical protein